LREFLFLLISYSLLIILVRPVVVPFLVTDTLLFDSSICWYCFGPC